VLGPSTVTWAWEDTYSFLLQAEDSGKEVLAGNSTHPQDMLNPWERWPEGENEILHDEVCLNINMVFIGHLQIKVNQNIDEYSVS
jgi:hypothetical protein